MKSKALIPLVGLGLLSVLIVVAFYLRAHGDTETDANQPPAVAPQEAQRNPSLPMKRLEGSDRAEILETIQKQQSRHADNSSNIDEPASQQIPSSQ